MSLIRIENLSKKYDDAHPIKDITVNIEKGDVISIIGPSGTGKSTFIRCINGLEKPTSGKIYVDDVEITDRKCDINQIRRKVGMVFQSFNLFGHKTILENIMMAPVDLLHIGKEEAKEEALYLLNLVGLSDKANNYPDQLSGGQKQRVAIARALAMKPEIILFDEPTSALDPSMVNEVQYVIKMLAKRGVTMMIVTHEMRFAKEIANRVFYLDQGIIYEDGTPEQIFENPQKELTQKFITQTKSLNKILPLSEMNFVELINEIAEFCEKSFLESLTTKKIEMVTEEIIMGIILQSEIDVSEIDFTINHSQTKEISELVFRYSSAELNPENTDNTLSKNIVNHYSSSVSFSYDPASRMNTFTAFIEDQ